jgi:hypothetical protein
MQFDPDRLLTSREVRGALSPGVPSQLRAGAADEWQITIETYWPRRARAAINTTARSMWTVFRVTHRTSFDKTRDVYSRRGRATSHLFDCDRNQACCITFGQPGRSVAKHKPPSTTPSYEWLPAIQPAMGKLHSWLISGVAECGGRHPIGRQERQRPEPGCSGTRQ